MAVYKQHENDPIADTELESWPEDFNGRVRVYGPSFKKMIPRSNVLSVLATSIVLSLGFGVLIGYFGHVAHHPEDHCFSDTLVKLTSEAHDKVTDEILLNINATSIGKYLEYLTKSVHLAGTDNNLATYVYNEWKDYKLDDVEMKTYHVLLSYPDQTKLNQVSLLGASGSVKWRSHHAEQPLTPDENDPNVIPPFNAYSASGNVTADLVYVNYGRYEDFRYVQNDLNISLEGKIALVRYGKNFRGSKVYNAELFNVSGVIMYSDPMDYAPKSHSPSKTYPNEWWLPDSGVQRGSVYVMNGDPLTIGYPSNAYMYREIPKKGLLPSIPVYPISYGDAIHLLHGLAGPEAPPSWRGKLEVPYNIGPGYTGDKIGWTVKLDVNLNAEKRPIYNVIGRINGTIEPDRYVILGNHRDAWTFGGSDPSSGTACLMEVVKTFGLLRQQGWKPRRTIIFASWDAEEYSIIGSTEWVEDKVRLLRDRAVAYLNVDISVLGNYSLRINASPLLSIAAFEAAKLIPNPNPLEVAKGRKTIYDTWVRAHPKDELADPADTHPRIGRLGSGSDFVAFLNLAGVSSIDIRYHYDDKLFNISSYPLYHTIHDTYKQVVSFIDPHFAYHKAIAQYWAELARLLADSYLLPLDVNSYAKAMHEFLDDAITTYRTTLTAHGISLQILTEAIQAFTHHANNFVLGTQLSLDKTDPMKVRMINDKLIQLERAFLDTNGLPGRPWYKHLLLAPSLFDFYNGTGFPALFDLLFILKYEIYNDTHLLSKFAVTTEHYSTLNTPSLATGSNHKLAKSLDSLLSTSALDRDLDFEDPNQNSVHKPYVNGNSAKAFLNGAKDEALETLVGAIKKHVAVLAFTIRAAGEILEQ